MKMKKNVIALVLVSCVMLVMVPLSMFGLLSLKNQGDLNAYEGEMPTVKILRMSRSVAKGEVIAREKLTVVQVPERYRCMCAVNASLLEEVVGKVAPYHLQEGQEVHNSVFGEEKCR